MTNLGVNYKDGVAIVTLNRPETRNSVTYAMWQGLGDVFGELSANPDVKSIILCGEGGDFSVGADIAEFASVRDDTKQAVAYEVAVDNGCAGITNAAKPVIAVNTGYCLGGGAHLAMSCDFRFAHTDALFGIPAAKLSIVYGVQATRKLLALVGLTESKRILYSAQRFDAAHALKIGFVDQVSDDPLGAALEFAAELANSAPLTMAGAKYILNGTALGQFEDTTADQMINQASASDDYREGRAAFAEKRTPQFKGA